MAKKKATHKANDIEQDNNPLQDQNQKKQNKAQERTLTLARQPSMEDGTEKLQNLKDLNSILLKETLERRQQVEALVHSKAALETELIRSGVEKSELECSLTRESDKNVCLEVEEGLFRFLVRTQMIEMGAGFDQEKSQREDEIRVLKSEVIGLAEKIESERQRLSEAFRERNLIKSDLDCQVKEANGFKERLLEMESKERDFKDEVLILKNQNEGLVKEKCEKDRDLEVVRKEKSLVEKRLAKTLEENEDFKDAVEVIFREKREIEIEASEQKVKNFKLDGEVKKLTDEIGLVLRREEKKEKVLREKVLELEKSYSEAVEKALNMALEIEDMRDDKNEKQKGIEKLMEEKEEVFRSLETALLEVNDKEVHIKKLLREKNEIEERKASQESEIVVMHKEIEELRDSVSALKELLSGVEEKNKQLVNEVTGYKNALGRAKFERDDIQKGLDEEKKNGLVLKSKIFEMEKKTKEKMEELAKSRNAHDNLVKEKKRMEDRMELLKKEKDSVQKKLLEAERGVDGLRAEMESYGINSDLALNMLKSTAALVCQCKDEVDEKPDMAVTERKLDDVADPYSAELEAIKNAFWSKEKLVEDMKKQVEIMQISVADAQKKKSFWTLVSSATTLFAAASVAYVARIR